MKVCPHCNASCEDSDIVCKNCGYLFSADNIPTADSAKHEQNTYEQPAQPTYQPPETPGYGFEGVPTPTPTGNNGLAIASFVLGIVGALFCWCYGFGLIPGAIGIILGIIALGKVKKTGQNGKGFAIAGIIVGAIGVVASILVIVYMVYIFTNPEFQSMYQKIMQQYSSSST